MQTCYVLQTWMFAQKAAHASLFVVPAESWGMLRGWNRHVHAISEGCLHLKSPSTPSSLPATQGTLNSLNETFTCTAPCFPPSRSLHRGGLIAAELLLFFSELSAITLGTLDEGQKPASRYLNSAPLGHSVHVFIHTKGIRMGGKSTKDTYSAGACTELLLHLQ